MTLLHKIIWCLAGKRVGITVAGCVCAKGFEINLDGERFEGFKKFYTGTTADGAETLILMSEEIPSAQYILGVEVHIFDGEDWAVNEYNRVPTTSNGFTIKYNDSHIKISNVGVVFRDKPYKLMIHYYLD